MTTTTPALAMAEALESAASDLLLEEVEYALGLHADHLQTSETEVVYDSRGKSHNVTVEIPEDVAEARLAYYLAKHRATASLLLVQARRLRRTACGENTMPWRDEDVAMRDPSLPAGCVLPAGHGASSDGGCSPRTPEQSVEVTRHLDLWAHERRHGLPLTDGPEGA